jgi:hypothetical protein
MTASAQLATIVVLTCAGGGIALIDRAAARRFRWSVGELVALFVLDVIATIAFVALLREVL